MVYRRLPPPLSDSRISRISRHAVSVSGDCANIDTASANSSKSVCFLPTSGNRRKNGTTAAWMSRRLFTSKYPAAIPSYTNRSTPKRLTKERERGDVVLRDVECCGDLPSTSIVSAAPTNDHEATFPEGETRKEVAEIGRDGCDGESFLLIARTRCIVRVD
jgi:hypothetical protein